VLKISSSMNASGGRWHHSPTARSVTSTLPKVAHLLLMHLFRWLMYGLKMSTTNVKQVTDFQLICGLSVFLSWCMCYPVWIHCCKRPNYDFCISQGSVATVLRWGGPNYSHICQVSSWCACQKLLKPANISRSYSKNKSGFLFWNTVYIAWVQMKSTE